ncbi:MAG: hypothetical protein ACKO2P_13065 [Planctomycetota bacterium]
MDSFRHGKHRVSAAMSILSHYNGTPELIVMTHPHRDHFEGMIDLIDVYPKTKIGCVIPARIENRNLPQLDPVNALKSGVKPTYDRVMQEWTKSPERKWETFRHATWSIEGLHVTSLHPIRPVSCTEWRAKVHGTETQKVFVGYLLRRRLSRSFALPAIAFAGSGTPQRRRCWFCRDCPRLSRGPDFGRLPLAQQSRLSLQLPKSSQTKKSSQPGQSNQTLRLGLAAGSVPATRGSGVVSRSPQPAERLRPQAAGTVPGRPETPAKVHGTETQKVFGGYLLRRRLSRSFALPAIAFAGSGTPQRRRCRFCRDCPRLFRGPDFGRLPLAQQ